MPAPATTLTPPAKLPPPHAQHLPPKRFQALLVARYGMVLEISANHRLQPLHRVLGLLMQALSQLPPNLLQLGRHALADRLPIHDEATGHMVLPTDVSETQKIEGF